jgi:hypothetical protein
MDEISNSDWGNDVKDSVPDVVKDNLKIIGLDDFSDFT